jgi:probable phosphoglycerate mutase
MSPVRSIDLGSSFLPELDGVCELLLVRHGEQGFVTNMALAEAFDAPLTELGRRQAAAVGERLAPSEIDAAYSSTLVRARDTALAVAAHHDLDVTEVEALGEIHLWRDLPQELGLVDAVGEEELRRILRDGNRTRRWDSYPHAEPRIEFRARIVDAIDQIMATHVGQRVVVACHGGVINGYIAQVMESELDTPCTIHHTSITTVRGMGDLRRVVQVNDHEHVRPLQTEINPLNAA